MWTKFLFTGFFTAAMALGVFASPGHAATQLLALLSTEGDVQLICKGGECTATFSTFCLQSERPSPPAGTAYQLGSNDDVRVTAKNQAGHEISLDPKQVLSITAMRTQVAVRFSIAKSKLEELGLRRVRVAVGKDITLRPVPIVGDPNPLSEAEIAIAETTLRQAGSQLVDANRVQTAAVRWLSGLINALPENDADEAMVRQRVVQSAVAGSLQSMTAGARELAQNTLSGCSKDLQLWMRTDLRGCLESAHDAFLWNLNADYWRAVRGGS